MPDNLITGQFNFKTDLKPRFALDNFDLIKQVFQKQNFKFDDFNFTPIYNDINIMQNVLIKFTMHLDNFYYESKAGKLLEPISKQYAYDQLLAKMRESNTQIFMQIKYLSEKLPKYLKQSMNLKVNDNLELKPCNITTSIDLTSEHDLVAGGYLPGIITKNANRQTRQIIKTQIAKPISQIEVMKRAGISINEITDKIIDYINWLNIFNGGLLLKHFKTPSDTQIWFYEGLHVEFDKELGIDLDKL